MAKPVERDVQLHQRLKSASERGIITIRTDFKALNTPKSPVFNPWESVVPLLGFLMVALMVMLFGGLIAGSIAFVFAILLYAVGIGPLNEGRIHHRALVYMFKSFPAFQSLWEHGGVIISMTDRPHVAAEAPAASWRNFVVRNLPEVDLGTPLAEELARSGGKAGGGSDRRGAGRERVS